MKAMSLARACALLLMVPFGLAGQDPPEEPTRERYESEGTVVIAGETVAYDAVVSSIILRDTKGNPTGEVFFTAYFRRGASDPARRPITFAYNGGPGSSSYWLHMGVLGPRRVRITSNEHASPAPYEVVDNAFSILAQTDLVMIDPVGTGFSRPLGDTQGSAFWGVDEDAASLTQFIQRFLSQHGRWNSPKYLLGESYGTMRSAVLAATLQGANIDLNGIILVSAVLDLQTLIFSPGDDVPYLVNLPAYAATSWYLDALPDRPPDLATFLREVEAFALEDYATALLAGNGLDPATRIGVLDRLHAYTGLRRDFLDRADLRVTAPEFEKELLRSQGKVVGRLDSRFVGPAGDLLAQTPSYDPQSSAISGAFTAAWNTYLRERLGYDGEREYVPSGNVQPWNWDHGAASGFGQAGITNVGPDLAGALRRNPTLEVLLVNGLYDLATPYFAAVWTMDHLGLPADLRDNIQREDFEAGHMMYIHEPLLPQWRQAMDAFYQRTSGSGG